MISNWYENVKIYSRLYSCILSCQISAHPVKNYYFLWNTESYIGFPILEKIIRYFIV